MEKKIWYTYEIFLNLQDSWRYLILKVYGIIQVKLNTPSSGTNYNFNRNVLDYQIQVEMATISVALPTTGAEYGSMITESFSSRSALKELKVSLKISSEVHLFNATFALK